MDRSGPGERSSLAVERKKRIGLFHRNALSFILPSAGGFIPSGLTMATKQQEKEPADSQKQEAPPRNAVIGKRVLHTLGRPDNFDRVQVRTLWGDYFRVNVLVDAEVASVKIAHSFFVLADADGNILSCNPKLTRLY
jgi:hypothetical protein